MFAETDITVCVALFDRTTPPVKACFQDATPAAESAGIARKDC